MPACSKYSLYDLSISDWTCIISLAHNWEFKEVKSLAVRELEKQELDVVERIALYQTYDVGISLLVPLYAILCSRDDPPNDEESGVLGFKTALLVYRARERLRAQPSDSPRSPLPSGMERDDVHNALNGLLGITSSSAASSPINGHTGESNSLGRWVYQYTRRLANVTLS